MARSTFSNADVEVEEVAGLHLEPEVQQQLLVAPRGEITLDEQAQDGSRTIPALLGDLSAPVEEGPGAGPDTSTPAPGIQLSPEETTENQLNEMIRSSDESSATAACEPGNQPDTGGQIPEALKIGPLTERQRARYMRGQMWNSVKKWFRCNWHWVLPAAVLAIIALIVLEILTGGTVTVAFEMIGAIMLGVSAVRAAMSIAQFGVNSLIGQIGAAARNFANAIAILTIELVMALTFGLGDTIASTQRGLKSAWNLVSKSGRAVGRGFARGARAVGRASRALLRGEVREAGLILRTAARGYVRRGKVVMAGLGRRFGTGYKNLRQLTRALYERVRFRRFVLRREGRMFQLWGEINPWVLLATGDIEFVEQEDLRVLGGNLDDTARLGDNVIVTAGGRRQQGTVIGRNRDPRQFVEELNPKFVSQNYRRELSKDLRGLVNREARQAVIELRESTAELRRAIPGPQPLNFQAHHVVPRELRELFQDLFDRVIPPFNIEDGLRNGIMVPPDGATLAAAILNDPQIAAQFGNSAFHLGSHPNYTLLMQRRLTTIYQNLKARTISRTQAGRLIDQVISEARTGIKNGAGTSINNVVF